MKRAMRFLVCGLVILIICLPALAQQTDINRYTLFTGFDYMISPARNLTERGFEGDFGVTVRHWLALGGDFGAMGDGIISGAGTINGSETVFAPAVNQSGLIPGGANSINVAFRSTTYTFAAGTQFYLRKWEKVTLFGRPGFGGIHENANIAFPPALVPLFTALQLPLPNAHQSDTELFFGLGGGFDVNVSKKVGARFAVDWVNTHLFSNLLAPRQNYIRFSVGPTFHWGHFGK
jgi:Outer membrane protein beta-barrel domain